MQVSSSSQRMNTPLPRHLLLAHSHRMHTARQLPDGALDLELLHQLAHGHVFLRLHHAAGLGGEEVHDELQGAPGFVLRGRGDGRGDGAGVGRGGAGGRVGRGSHERGAAVGVRGAGETASRVRGLAQSGLERQSRFGQFVDGGVQDGRGHDLLEVHGSGGVAGIVARGEGLLEAEHGEGLAARSDAVGTGRRRDRPRLLGGKVGTRTAVGILGKEWRGRALRSTGK